MNHLYFRDLGFHNDLGLLASRHYELAGKLVAWSILHGQNGPCCLSSVGYDLQQSVQVNLVNAVNDVDVKSMLQEFMNCQLRMRSLYWSTSMVKKLLNLLSKNLVLQFIK